MENDNWKRVLLLMCSLTIECVLLSYYRMCSQVFAMENDNWKRSNGKADTAAEFVSRALPLSDLTHYVSGTSLMSHHHSLMSHHHPLSDLTHYVSGTSLMSHHHSLMSHHHPLSDLTHYVSGTSSLPQTPNPKP